MEQITNSGWDQRIHIFRADEKDAGEQVDAFAIVTQKYLVFIDTLATPALARQMVNEMKDYLDGREPLVINTHADYDHCWGNAVFANGGELPAPIYGHEHAAKRLTSVEDQLYLTEQQQTDPRYFEVRLIPPTITMREQTTVNCGDIHLELIPTPGHCPDHIAVWVPNIRHLFVGDAAESPFPYVSDASTLPMLIHSLELLANLKPAIVLPCHGGTIDPQLLTRNLKYFSTVRERCQESIAHNSLPPKWNDFQNITDIVNMPYEEAMAIAQTNPFKTAKMYRQFHDIAIKSTIISLSAKIS